jgi:ADP-heptose:LPS heptosyltransferase
MTARETQIAKKILDCLHNEEGRQLHAQTIHGEIGGLNVCNTRDFENVLNELEKMKFVIGVKTKFRGEVWNISDAGEAARLEMA